MLAGCLPLLVQLPFFSVMYRLFLSKTVAGHPNALLARDFITTPLGSHLLAGAGLIGIHGLVFLGLFAVLAGVTFLATRAAKSAAVAAALAAGTVAAGTVTASTAAAGQPGLGWLGQVLPYTTLIIAAFVPLAAVLYLVTTTSWTAAERAVLRRWHRGAGQVASPG
jgi:YidC/Oxa1 family membrane protein insertase